jgi:hypothetical protein
MKKLSFSIFLAMLLALATFSQETFFTQIDDDNFHNPMDIIIKQDGNMLFCSQYHLPNQSWKSVMFEVDKYGEIINEVNFYNTGDDYLRSARILQLDDHVYLFGEGRKNNNADVSMLKFDLQLNKIEHHHYNINGINPGSIFPMKVLCINNIFHIMGLARLTYNFQPPFYLKVSSSGIMLNSSYYNPGPYVEMWPQDFYLSPGSDNLFAICQDWRVTNNSWAHFIEFDRTMSVVSDLPLATGKLGFIMLSYTIFRESDSTFFLAHNFWDVMPP